MLLARAIAIFPAVLLPIHALASQIPVIDGVIGGAPSDQSKSWIPNETAKDVPTAKADAMPGALRVTENPGICETTPGVYSATGYGDLTETQSIWFWYFASRNDNDTAPLSLWFNGGPGSSSMLGLFQENGPCRITNDSNDVTLNPQSWNNRSNMLYIDQPVGVGFSHGDRNVATSQQAAVDVWKFLQIFFSDTRFKALATTKLAIWTESYGGHYGPVFAAYFISQNAAIDAGTISGLKINLQVLGIGNGLTNPLVQYASYTTYAASNPYHPLVTDSILTTGNQSWEQPGGCRDQIAACYETGTNRSCHDAQSYCNSRVLTPLHGAWDVYYVPVANPDPYPPHLTDYLNSIATQIGAETEWVDTDISVYSHFADTGDWMHNSAPELESVIDAGIRTIIYDGDADFILNFYGVEAMADNLTTTVSDFYAQQTFQNYTVNGEVAGIYKNAGTFSYVRIFGAGHEVPAYSYGKLGYGVAALQMFEQIMSDSPLIPT